MKNPPRRLSTSLARILSDCESGNALIELAASLPLYLVLLLAAYASQSRENSPPANIANIALAAQNEAPKFITSPSTQVTSTQACSCVGSDGSSAGIARDQHALRAWPC